MEITEGKMKAAKYKHIFSTRLFRNATVLGLGRYFAFNDPKHKGKTTLVQ